MKPLKIIFAGTPDFAALHLDVLLKSHHEVVAVYTKQDKPAGRGKKIQASHVKQMAVAADIPVYQPKTLRDPEAQAEVAALEADIMVVVAYGLILPQAVLDMPRYGCINVHGSLLPLWRGAAPIQRSLWAGDQETGVTIMQMDAGLDTGAMLLKASCPIEPTDTSGSLYDKLAAIGPQALCETLEQIGAGTCVAEVQDESLVTYAEKLSKEEARIDWSKPAATLDREVRAFNPWPMSYFEHQGMLIKVRRVEVLHETVDVPVGSVFATSPHGIDIVTGEGLLRLCEIQLPSKSYQPVRDILNSPKISFNVGMSVGS